MSASLSVKEASEALGYSVDTLYRHLKSGKIYGYRITEDGDWRIPINEVERIRAGASAGVRNDRNPARA